MHDVSDRFPQFFVGLDLGQATDPTALAVVERRWAPTGKMVWPEESLESAWAPEVWGEDAGLESRVPELIAAYQVSHLERLPLGTPYPAVVTRVTEVIQQVGQQLAVHRDTRLFRWTRRWGPGPPPRNLHPPEEGRATLAIDATGVGRPVVDMVLAANLNCDVVPITIHGGDTATSEGSGFRVPKRDLIAAVRLALDDGRFRIASGLPDAGVLVDELLNYRLRVNTVTLHDSYNAREGQHDDLLLAVACAIWTAEQPGW